MTNPEFSPDYLRDFRPEEKPVEQIEADNAKLVELAKEQLEQVGSSLKDLSQRIITEKPDMVVFLDKGARVLATPIAKFIRDKMDNVPEIRFYNDDELKSRYVEQKNIQEVIESDFVPYKDKKVFFIDETYSEGKGAAALSKAILSSGIDGHYFALTKDPKPMYDEDNWDRQDLISYKNLVADVERLKQQGRADIYENNVGYLFTKRAASLYVRDGDEGTGLRYEIIPEGKVDEAYDYTPKRGELPHGRYFMDEHADRDWKEYDRQVRLSNRKTVEQLKTLVSETLETYDKS